jgi:unsaturated rhamnogalacturonyl hydrolase
MKNSVLSLTAIFILSFITEFNCKAQTSQTQLQLKISPVEIGNRISENIVNRRFGWRYQKVCTYYGALNFAEATGNRDIAKQIIEGYSPWLKGKKKPHSGHVDYNVFGIWPFEIYRQTGNEKIPCYCQKTGRR